MNSHSIAIVYDRVNKSGGAERLLQALHELFPESTLVTSVYDPNGAPWAKGWKVQTSWLQRVPFARRHHEWFALLMPLAFESLDLSKFDVVISVTSEAAKGVITSPRQKHICYCLTPTRYLWSHTSEYEGTRFRWIKRMLFSTLREWDFIAAQRPDVMIAISDHVKERIEKYYHRSVDQVIYPPTGLVNESASIVPASKRSYYLVVSRLVPYKHTELAIEACRSLHVPLKIVGVGSDWERLQEIAGDDSNVEFLGAIDDEALRDTYAHAKALICPQEEDFGLVSVEAQRFGTPVVSLRASGVAETITPGKTGILFDEQTAASLKEALEECEGTTWKHEGISTSAKRFALSTFQSEFRSLVKFA